MAAIFIDMDALEKVLWFVWILFEPIYELRRWSSLVGMEKAQVVVLAALSLVLWIILIALLISLI